MSNALKQRIALVCILSAAFIIALTSVLIISNMHRAHTETVQINTLEIYVNTPPTQTRLTKEEYSKLYKAGVVSFSSYSDYLSASDATAQFSIQTKSVHADGANKILYDLADQYFQVYYGAMRISPLFPMAVSNVETPGRADHSITWSSLFPTKYISIDEVYTFDVTQVLRDYSLYKALSTEYSTRDRGCLQMSPTYGTGNADINERMSGTEKDKLSAIDTTQYAPWISGASNSPGDRFYLPDVLLRMQSAMQSQVEAILQNDYKPSSDLQLIAMLAMSHQSSGIWYNKDHSKPCGTWRSSEACYDWSKIVSSSEVINALTEYAATHDAVYIDTSTASSIFQEVSTESYTTYANNINVCTYPIKCLYAYIKLCQLYMT